MELIPTRLPEVLIVQPKVFGDNRGYFCELYRQEHTRLGLELMVQVNISRSQRNVVRGLHCQSQQPQAKLISVIRGTIFDVAVDIRRGSPTFGQWCGQVLSDENHLQLYVPIGFAHGFCVLSDEVDMLYQCSDYYHPQTEVGILWNDPDIAIEWPTSEPILSSKDQQNVRLAHVAPALLPSYPALV